MSHKERTMNYFCNRQSTTVVPDGAVQEARILFNTNGFRIERGACNNEINRQHSKRQHLLRYCARKHEPSLSSQSKRNRFNFFATTSERAHAVQSGKLCVGKKKTCTIDVLRDNSWENLARLRVSTADFVNFLGNSFVLLQFSILYWSDFCLCVRLFFACYHHKVKTAHRSETFVRTMPLQFYSLKNESNFQPTLQINNNSVESTITLTTIIRFLFVLRLFVCLLLKLTRKLYQHWKE